MPHRKIKNADRLTARERALFDLKARLETRIAEESRRPLPDMPHITTLKRLKLRAKDEIASIQSLMRALDRGQRSRRRPA